MNINQEEDNTLRERAAAANTIPGVESNTIPINSAFQSWSITSKEDQ